MQHNPASWNKSGAFCLTIEYMIKKVHPADAYLYLIILNLTLIDFHPPIRNLCDEIIPMITI